MSDRILKESDVIREVESLLVSDEMRHLNDLEYGNNQALYHVVDCIEDLPSADAIPIEWIIKVMDAVNDSNSYEAYEILNWLLDLWRDSRESFM